MIPRLLPVDERTKDLLNSPTIMDQLPVTFDNDFKLTEFSGECIKCERPILPENMRGTVTRPFSYVAVIEARGACPHCRIGTKFKMRVKEDGKIEYIDTRGAWVCGYLQEPTRLQRAISFLKNLPSRR